MQFKCDFCLPFLLPIEDKSRIVSGTSYGEFITTFETLDNTITSNDKEEKRSFTIMKIDFCLFKNYLEREDTSFRLRFFVNETIKYINYFLDAYRASTDNCFLKNITITDLPITLTIELDDTNFLYITNAPNLMAVDIGGEALKKTISYMHMWDKYPEIATFDRLFSSAKSLVLNEHFIQAIIELETSFEVFVRFWYKFMLEQNKINLRISDLAKIPLQKLIKEKLPVILTNHFSSKNTKIKDWYRYLYKIRNEIVHQGRSYINLDEANNALLAYVAARNYIADSMQKNNYLDKDNHIALSLLQKNKNIPEFDIESVKIRLKEKGIL